MLPVRQRLSECELESIFDSVSQNELPPSHLDVRVIRVPKKNAKISPPPFEYDEGIYVLLHSKECLAPVPSALSNLVMTEKELADLGICHWRSSGVKSNSANVASAKYFVRYCYPHGENGCGDNIAASVWTMRDSGNEIFHTRILHIYKTKKRSIGESYGRSSKKKSVKVPNCHDDVDGLMKADLITTPTRDYKDADRVAFSSPEIMDPQFLFDLDNDSVQFLFPERPVCSAVPSPVRISMSPVKSDVFTTFERKIGDLTNEILLSNKEDQARMILVLKQQLEVLGSSINHGENELPSAVKAEEEQNEDKCSEVSNL